MTAPADRTPTDLPAKRVRLLMVGLLALALAAGCAGEDPNLTESGKGRPQVTVSMPSETETGSEQQAEITVTNPGPGAMETVVVAFAAVGPRSGQRDMPVPIVAFGSGKENPAVVSIDPEPTAVSQDAVVFTFGPRCPDGSTFPDGCPGLSRGDVSPRLGVGETITLTFTLKMPVLSGWAANSVQVYDGQEIDRAGGARLETLVGR